MCLIVFSYRQHPEYDLIFAANRDEKYSRPARHARYWDEHPSILAGKDLKAGGTWMGINKEGTFSALTNFRKAELSQKEDPPSRGQLVLEFLKNDRGAVSYLEEVHKQADRYRGFSLLAGSPDQLAYYSNQQNEIQLLDSGLYALSNHLLDTPWPKVKRAKEGLRNIIRDDPISQEALFELLADDREAPAEHLPNTGLSRELEKKVSPIFIKSDGYGTRCSTLLLIDKGGEVTFRERRFKPGTLEIKDEHRYQFSIAQ